MDSSNTLREAVERLKSLADELPQCVGELATGVATDGWLDWLEASVPHIKVALATLQQPAAEPSISTDGPHTISSHRKWLARQLLDSQLSDTEAFGIVTHSPAMKGIPGPAAEPVASDHLWHRDGKRWTPPRNWQAVYDAITELGAKPDHIYTEVERVLSLHAVELTDTIISKLSTTDVEREEIARVIDPMAFEMNSWDATEAVAMSRRRVTALAKADQIKALFASKSSGSALSQPCANGSPDPILTDGQHSDGGQR